MSFSFVIHNAKSKADAKAQVAAQMEHLRKHQPAHEEVQAVETAANAYIDLLPEPKPPMSIRVAIAGSVSGQWQAGAGKDKSGRFDPMESAQVNISVAIEPAH